MGTVRTLLAITVVIGHSYGFVLTGPILAVQIFYVISGFLISFILTEVKAYESHLNFYLNRILRIFPVYWVVTAGTISILLAAKIILDITPPAFEIFQKINAIGRFSLTFSNLFIFGQDWIMFTSVRDGTFQFSSDYRDSELAVWRGLLIPPAWTLGVELSFYLVAPLVLTRPRMMFVLLFGSLLLRILLVLFGPGLSDPWNYRFFPTELGLFLIGALSHQFWKPWLGAYGLVNVKSSILITGLVLVSFFLFPHFPIHQIRWILLIGIVAASLPFLFYFQGIFNWDRWVGELSYPIYIAHWTIFQIVNFLWDRMSGIKGYRGWDETVVIIVITLAAALVLNRFVARPIERFRMIIKAR